VKEPKHRLDWALSRCGDLQLRTTSCRRAILEVLAESSLPLTLGTISKAVSERNPFDPATVYRSLSLFQEAEIIRSVGTTSKSTYYFLNMSGEHCHFLICRRCGAIKPSPCGHHLDALEDELTRSNGYAEIYHELTFYGICPSCQHSPTAPLPVKLRVRS
jgi:Fur family ferric uptake transcriptional regulator